MLVLVIMTQEGGSRINALLGSQSQGPKRWFVAQGNVPENSVFMDKRCRDISVDTPFCNLHLISHGG